MITKGQIQYSSICLNLKYDITCLFCSLAIFEGQILLRRIEIAYVPCAVSILKYTVTMIDLLWIFLLI